ncbi:MAG: PrsW family glutamic-type intramembrane protease [bacterium]
MLLSLAAVALAPALALGVFFYLRDRYKKEPLRLLLLVFALGAAALVPAMATSYALQQMTGWTSSAPSLLARFVGALLVVGMVEEGWKFVVVRLVAYDRPEFDEPYDGIMYAVTAALGFATVENLLYVYAGGFGVGVLRALLAVPGHAFYGVLMGYWLGEAKFAGTRLRAAGLQLAGLGLAVLAHGVYDFIIFALDRRPLMLLVLPVYAALTWVIFFRATRLHAAQSFRRHPALRDFSDRPGEPPVSPPAPRG